MFRIGGILTSILILLEIDVMLALLPPSTMFIHSRWFGVLHNPQLNEKSFDEALADEDIEFILNHQGLVLRGGGGDAFESISPQSIASSIKLGFSQRLAADPNFLLKSILEVILAAATQYMAEVSQRGWKRIIIEIDFVFAGILTAVIGKYYSAWRVAKTIDTKESLLGDRNYGSNKNSWRDHIPTNAFQRTLLDGHTVPSLSSRFLAFIVPMPQLFRAGVIASTIGYGLTSVLISIRKLCLPSYVAQTSPVSVPLAALYTGVFMAFVSNIRYQVLQGVVEPYIEVPFDRLERLGERNEIIGKIARWRIWKSIKGLIIVAVRWGNGLLGSWIAIGGMRALKLQQLKNTSNE
jgi:hypothetical protein